MYKLEELNTKKVAELQVIAKELHIKKPEKLNKEELAYAILDCQAENAKATENPIRKPRPRTKSTKNKGFFSSYYLNQFHDRNMGVLIMKKIEHIGIAW